MVLPNSLIYSSCYKIYTIGSGLIEFKVDKGLFKHTEHILTE